MATERHVDGVPYTEIHALVRAFGDMEQRLHVANASPDVQAWWLGLAEVLVGYQQYIESNKRRVLRLCNVPDGDMPSFGVEILRPASPLIDSQVS